MNLASGAGACGVTSCAVHSICKCTPPPAASREYKTPGNRLDRYSQWTCDVVDAMAVASVVVVVVVAFAAAAAAAAASCDRARLAVVLESWMLHWC